MTRAFTEENDDIDPPPDARPLRERFALTLPSLLAFSDPAKGSMTGAFGFAR